MNLGTPQSVRKLQRALYAKAKANPTYRFYTLHDKIYRNDVLKEAWSRCRANDGSSGVDGQSFEGIESKGVERWLEQLAQAKAGHFEGMSDFRPNVAQGKEEGESALGLDGEKGREKKRSSLFNKQKRMALLVLKRLERTAAGLDYSDSFTRLRLGLHQALNRGFFW